MKEFDPKQKSQGLGDTIAKFTHFFGIEQAGGLGSKKTRERRIVDVIGEVKTFKQSSIL